MATLSSAQLTDLRGDVGDVDSNAFTDDELNRLYTRADSDYEATVILALWQLLISAVKFRDFVVGFTRDEAATIFDNMKAAYELRRQYYSGKKQVMIAGLEVIPTYRKTEPTDSYDWGRDEPVPADFYPDLPEDWDA
jgi:hypothetical protein